MLIYWRLIYVLTHRGVTSTIQATLILVTSPYQLGHKGLELIDQTVPTKSVKLSNIVAAYATKIFRLAVSMPLALSSSKK